MITISITEKLWDGVRPDSVKKTGLSEAIRTFIKANPKGGPDSPKGYDDLADAVKTLGEAIGKSEEPVKKAKDDKKGAAAKLKSWKEECSKAVEQLHKERNQLGLLKASAEADGRLKELAKTVDDAILLGKQLAKDMAAGKITDNKKISQQLQDLRSAMRDGLKATQKDGFVDFIRTYDAVLKWKIDPAEVPLPPICKTIKSKLPELQAVAEDVRKEAEKVLEESAKSAHRQSSRSGQAARRRLSQSGEGNQILRRSREETRRRRPSDRRKIQGNHQGGNDVRQAPAQSPDHARQSAGMRRTGNEGRRARPRQLRRHSGHAD